MAGNGALDLSIRIMGKVDPSLANAIGQTKKLTGSLGQALMGTKSMTSTVADALEVIGKAGLAATAAFTAVATTGIKSCTDEAKKFEAQMAPVMRYVDGLADGAGKASEAMASNGQTFAQNYAEMKDYIQDLSRDIPRTTEQITTISAALGQSGKGFSDQVSTGILRDTTVAATAMDLDDQTAGEYMAKWEVAFSKKDEEGNRLNYSHDDVMRLMNQINYLGANNATTAAEIALSVNRSASIGQLAGVDPSTSAAIATAMQATGVDADRTGTAISRIYTNVSKGSSATNAQKEMWEELGFTATGVAKSMQEDGTKTLMEIFGAINKLPDERKVSALNTLFGQWVIEGGAKITNNLELLQTTLAQVSDPAAYSNSMEREFAINSGTAESIDIMKSNAKTVLMQDAGDAFLPAYKELARLQLDIYKDIDDNLPNLEQLVTSFMPLLRTAVEGIGGAIKTALPYAQKFIDAMAKDPGQAMKTISGIIGLFATMSAAPKIYGTASSIASVGGGFALGGRSSGIPGGTLGGITVSDLLGMLSPTNLFQNAVSGGKSLWENRNRILKSAKTGAWMANSSGQGGLAGKISSAAGGVLGALNYGALTSGKKKPMQTVANKIFGVSGYINNVASIPANAVSAMVAAANPAGTATATIGNVLGAGAGAVFGKNGLNVTGGIASVVGKLGGGFMSLLGTFGPAITGVGTLIAVVSLLGDHFEDIRGIVGNVFGETGLAIFDAFAGKIGGIAERIKTAFSPEELMNIQQSLSDKTFFGINLGAAFGSAMPLIQSVVSVIQQIVDLGVDHIKPVLKDIISFVVDKGLPAVMPLLSMIVSVIGTTLVNAIKVVVDLVGKLLPIVEPVVLGIIDIVKGIASVGVTVVNFIIRALNKLFFTVPEWVPAIGGKQFGFDLAEVPLPAFANGGFTSGPSIAGEAGMEAVISFRRSQRENNIKTWMEAGKMLGISNLAYFPTVTDAALTLRNLQNLQRFRREVELRLPIGADSDGGTSPHRTGGEYSRTYTSRSGNTYVYAPNFTVYGSMNEDELHSIMEQGYERFCEYVERYEQEKRRRGYGT